jgi:hypothetical protein
VIPRKEENSRGVRKENLVCRFWEMKSALALRLNPYMKDRNRMEDQVWKYTHVSLMIVIAHL